MAEYKQEPLGYNFNDLEPYIDAKTMEIHYTKHHAGYIQKLNAALEKYPELKEMSAEELIMALDSVPEDIRTAVRNNGGGHINHTFFWQTIGPNAGGNPEGEIAEAINSKFGNFEEFKKEFSVAALGIFGSGWAWLVLNNGELEVMTTPNQDSPLSEGKTPILGLDMWEHSMYLLYKNDKPAYLNAFFKVINWEQVNQNFEKAKE